MPNTTESHTGKKLLYFLQDLSTAEVKKFHQYLSSRLLCKRPHFVKVLEILEKEVLKKGLDQIPPEIFRKIFSPESPMNDKKRAYIRMRLAQFLQELLNFLAFQEYQKNKVFRNQNLIRASIAHGKEKYLKSFYQKGIKDLPNTKSADYFLHKMELEIELNRYLAQHAVKGQDLHLKEVHDALDRHFILQKLKYSCAAYSLQMVWGQEVEISLLDPILKIAEEHKEVPSISAYFHACRMMTLFAVRQEESIQHFQQLMQLLHSPLPFKNEEEMDLFLYAQNFCIWQFHKGEKSYLPKLRNLYDQMLKRMDTEANKLLSPKFYKNTVALMCRFGELNWAESFVENYRNRISGDEKKMAYLYNLAVLRFHQKKYRETVSLLFPEISKFEDVLYAVGARFYLCRALWELKEMDWLGYILQSLNQFVRRSKDLSPADKDRQRKFIRYMENILKATTGNPDKTLQKLLNIREEMENRQERQLYNWISSILEQEIEKEG